MRRDYSDNPGMNSAILEPHPCVDVDYINKSNTFSFFRKWGTICGTVMIFIYIFLYGFVGILPAMDLVAKDIS